LLDELKYLLQLPCSAWLPSYDASLLDVNSVLASLPWAVHWRISVADAAKQRFLGAREEMVLVKREIESAEKYYSHFISECERTANVLHHKQEMALEKMSGTAELEGEFLLVAMRSLTGPMKATIIQHVIRGKLEVLQYKMSMYHAQLKEICALMEELQAFGSQVQGSAIHDVCKERYKEGLLWAGRGTIPGQPITG